MIKPRYNLGLIKILKTSWCKTREKVLVQQNVQVLTLVVITVALTFQEQLVIVMPGSVLNIKVLFNLGTFLID
jgi:hypothetical protein